MAVVFRNSVSILFLLAFSGATLADIPEGYYDTVDISTGEALHQSLHEIIDDHTRFPYTSSQTDTWDILEQADQDPDNALNIIDVYKNASYPKQGGGNSLYNREHVWPKSYGFPDDNDGNYPFTDTHHLFLSNDDYNSERSNKPFDSCDSGCVEFATELNNGRGGTTMDSNFTSGDFTDGKWETWRGRKGDVARAIFYMAVRYEGGTHGETGSEEPDLRITDDRELIDTYRSSENGEIGYMGLRTVLLQWHEDDPVDDFERRRNDTIYSYQGNRNPFIDHPEYVVCVFNADCSDLGGTDGDTQAPAAPQGLAATESEIDIVLNWTANQEEDLAGYNVYRAAEGQSFSLLNSALIEGTTTYSDSTAELGVAYQYYVTAVDTSSNESSASDTISASIVDNAPAQITGVTATADSDSIAVNWNANNEDDLAGYDVYRNLNGAGFSKVNTSLIVTTQYIDNDLSPGDSATYYVVAVDNAGNVSEQSASASASIADEEEPQEPEEPDTGNNSSGGGSLSFFALILLVLSRFRKLK
ncbi:endonuclease [Pleionea sediminis]|uniref:endonuclease n=1 Tax=Pleionea sediminis TaxID=2569479 RepID=UPI001186F334|nr:endonuclease [Pleionea sediminis]